MRSTRRDLAELLVACVREHDWTAPDADAVERSRRVPPDRVVAAADYHRVAGCVLASLRGDPRTPADLLAQLDVVVRRSTGRAVLAAEALRSVRPILDPDLTWLVIKGPVLDPLYPRARLRTYRDLDVLVHARDFETAVDRFGAAGFTLVDRNWRLIRERMASELHFEREGCAPIDLHWALVFGQQLRKTFDFPLTEMIDRAVAVQVGGLPTRTLDPADTLIHLAVHAAGEGGDRLIWLKDIDVVARAGVDWDAVVERSVRYGVTLPVATILSRSSRALGAPVPSEVVARLAPASWRRLTGATDRLFPLAATRGFGNPASLLARSARSDVRSTLRRALSGVGRRARGLVGRGQLERVDPRTDATHPGSLLYPDGDESDRERYFARLSSM